MRIGPVSSFDLNRLQALLDSHHVKYKVEVSQDDLAAYDEKRLEKSRAPRMRPTFEGVMDYIYLEFPDDARPLIADELQKLGYGFEATGHELDEVNDGFEERAHKHAQFLLYQNVPAALVAVIITVIAIWVWLKNR